MDPATSFTLVLALIAAVPTLLLELARIRLPRPEFHGRLGAVVALVLLLRVSPAGAAVPPPSERIELPQPPVEKEPQETGPVNLPSAPAGDRYVVAPGDSLWAIACRHLSSDGHKPSAAEINRYWKAIYAANRALLGDDPDLIFAGQRLVLPPSG